MPEHPEVARVQRFLSELAELGTAALPRHFSPDVVWHVADGNPEPGTGRGLDSLAAYYARHRLRDPQGVKIEEVTVLAGNAHAAVFLKASVAVPGGPLDMLLPQLFRRGPDGLWCEHWILAPPKRMPRLPQSLEELDKSGHLDRSWYYSIELAPGVFTPGRGYVNLGLTRKLLAGAGVEGRRCLDIGTMEGAVPLLLSRRGAAEVVGVDVMASDPEVQLVRHYTGARFAYHGGLTHLDTAPFLFRRYRGNFDVVVLSGVLYHCWGPLHTLAMARSLVRTGGLLLVETNAAVDSEHSMQFNTGGRFSPDGSTYFLTAVPLLEYLLRYLKLQPLDCVAGPHTMDGDQKAVRVAVMCRAVDEIPGADPWMNEASKQVDYLSLIAWHLIGGDPGDPVRYGPAASPFVDPTTGICDVVRTVRQSPAMPLPPEVAVIRLDDTT